MADEEKQKWAKPLIIGGVVIGVGALSYLGIKALTDFFRKTEQDKNEIIQNIMDELKDRDAYWAQIMQKEYITEDEQAYLDAKDDALIYKELALKSLDTNAWTQFVHDLQNLGLALGVAVLIPIAGLVCYQWFNQRLKKWPLQKGQPPPQIGGGGGSPPLPDHPVCPYDGEVYANDSSLVYHLIHDHPATTNQAAISAAQEQYRHLTIQARQRIGAEVVSYGYSPPHTVNWLQIGGIALAAISAGLIIIGTYGAAASAAGGIARGIVQASTNRLIGYDVIAESNAVLIGTQQAEGVLLKIAGPAIGQMSRPGIRELVFAGN